MSSGLAKKEGCLLGKLSSISSEEGKSAFGYLVGRLARVRDATTKLVVASLFLHFYTFLIDIKTYN